MQRVNLKKNMGMRWKGSKIGRERNGRACDRDGVDRKKMAGYYMYAWVIYVYMTAIRAHGYYTDIIYSFVAYLQGY